MIPPVRPERSLRDSPRGARGLVGLAFLLPAISVLAAACDERVHEVRLAFTDDGQGVRGFVCKEPGGGYLALRAVETGHASIVVDYIRLGGAPLCRPVKLLDWCRDHGCPILKELRACLDLPAVPPDASIEPGHDPVGDALRSLQGSLVSPDAPEEPVLVRVVATARTCAEVEAGGVAFECESLIGCANSCPVFLPSVGEVPLDLDVSSDQCEAAVIVCASADLGDPDTSCSP